MTALPAFIDKEAWQGFCDMRKATKKPLTARAEMLILKALYALKDAGHDPNASLDQSSLHSWADVYEPKDREITKVKREYMTSLDGPMTAAQKESADKARRLVMSNLRRVA